MENTNLQFKIGDSSEWKDVEPLTEMNPLVECMMGRDGDCDHPKCPITIKDAEKGIYCTLPLNDYRE